MEYCQNSTRIVPLSSRLSLNHKQSSWLSLHSWSGAKSRSELKPGETGRWPRPQNAESAAVLQTSVSVVISHAFSCALMYCYQFSSASSYAYLHHKISDLFFSTSEGCQSLLVPLIPNGFLCCLVVPKRG